MRKIKEYFKKNITPDKILKLNKNDFMKVFLQGTIYEEDFDFLKTELPEYLDNYKINDHWFDKHGIYREIKDNHFIICNNTKHGLIISGEIKFTQDGTPLFGKFSENGSFYRLDNLIINKNKVYKGTIPDSEVNIKRDYPSEISFIMESLEEENPLDFKLEYDQANLKLKILKKEKELHIDINLDNFSEINTYLKINDVLINNIHQSNNSKPLNLDEEIYKEYEVQINEIGKIFLNVKNNDFKEKELESYLKIFNELSDILNDIDKNFR